MTLYLNSLCTGDPVGRFFRLVGIEQGEPRLIWGQETPIYRVVIVLPVGKKARAVLLETKECKSILLQDVSSVQLDGRMFTLQQQSPLHCFSLVQPSSRLFLSS